MIAAGRMPFATGQLCLAGRLTGVAGAAVSQILAVMSVAAISVAVVAVVIVLPVVVFSPHTP